MKFGQKLAILSKKNINRELICNKKFLKADKKSRQKKAFVVFLKQ